ncbi:MAG: hypothetical protein RSD40_01025, partial [Bacilli bacterium]
ESGILEDGAFEETEIGSPQGGVISPLLMNIYMVDFDNEMVELVKNKVQSLAEESVKKELLRERVKRELSGNRNKDSKNIEKKENKVRRNVKDKITSNLQSIISDNEINIINDIEDRKELECHLIELKEQGKYDERILNKLISILNK